MDNSSSNIETQTEVSVKWNGVKWKFDTSVCVTKGKQKFKGHLYSAAGEWSAWDTYEDRVLAAVGMHFLGMSCPSWQWHRTGSCWSPVRTLPVAPLWCDLGLVPNSRGNKAVANPRPTH